MTTANVHTGNSFREGGRIQGIVTQGFLYAPFGEITTEYNTTFGSDIIPKYAFNAKELDEETGMYYYEARYYKPPVFTSRDPMFEKYFWMSPYAYCANNPVKYVDPSGEFPVWAVVGATLEYGFQVYDNYKSGASGVNAWYGDIDFFDVALSAVNPTEKCKIVGTLLIEGAKAAINISKNDGFKVAEDATTVAKKTVVNTLVGVGAGKAVEAGSEKALQSAGKEVATASQKLKAAESKAQRKPNSTKLAENVYYAKYSVESARNRQVRVQMLYSTVGQAPNATQVGVKTIANRGLKNGEQKQD